MIREDTQTLAKCPGFYELIARQFSFPQGQGGLTVAAAMRLINWLPNKRAIDLLGVRPSDDLLEIGFGPGHALKRLSKLAPFGSVTGVDRSGTMFRQASARNRGTIAEGRLSLKRGFFEKLPLENASVDRILAVNVIYFVGALTDALSEARRVLRPGGSMVIYVTDRSSMEWLQFVGSEMKHTFDVAGLDHLLRRSAFEADDIKVQRIWLPLGFRGILANVNKLN